MLNYEFIDWLHIVLVRSRRTQRSGFYEYEDPSHGFQGDMTAEEIFNMFFGGGMPGSSGRRDFIWFSDARLVRFIFYREKWVSNRAIIKKICQIYSLTEGWVITYVMRVYMRRKDRGHFHDLVSGTTDLRILKHLVCEFLPWQWRRYWLVCSVWIWGHLPCMETPKVLTISTQC